MISKTSTSCLVTVTYGNRGGLVVKVLEAAVNCGIDSVVVIDNGATPESVALIRAYAESCDVHISIVSMGRNTGSAGGFKRGLEEAYRSGADFIWLLDDDNQPEVDALVSLQTAYRLLGDDKRVVLCSYRRDRKPYFLAVEYGEVPDVRENSFLDFNILNKLSKLFFGRGRKRQEGGRGFDAFPLVLTKIAPYGGLYLHRSWIEKAGVPDENFFLYGDDHEYSSRIIRQGGVVYICAASRINDIDPSWTEVRSSVPSWVSKESNETKVFYTVRNRVFFEGGFVSNVYIYYINMLIYLLYLGGRAFFQRWAISSGLRRLVLISNAIYFGVRSRKDGFPSGFYQGK